MKQDRVKPQGMMQSSILQHIEVLYNTLDSATCFLYGPTYQPNPLSNIIQKALTTHLSSAPRCPPGMRVKEKYSIMSLVL
jgi:hypothetical protein